MTRLLLIGAAGMDWPGYEAATRSGALPAFSALASRGLSGWLAGAPVSPGPAAWASMVSGVQPEVHGVWSDTEEWPGGLRGVGKASWRVAPLWATLEAAGISTGSVAWWATRPGADWAGIHVDDAFAEATGRTGADWALPRRCVPDALRDVLRGRRVHPLDITAAMLAPLVPDLPNLDQRRDDGLPMIAVGLARAATIQAAAVWMLAQQEPRPAPDAVFIRQPWLARIRLTFERRREPRFAGVIPAAWRFLDQLVGRLAALAGPDTLVLVASPGWRGAPGVVVVAGPGVSAEGDFLGADLMDIAPTVLARFGLADARLPGRRIAPSRATAFAAPADLAPAPHVAPAPPEKPDARLVYALRKHGFRPPPRPGRPWRAQRLANLAQMMLERDPAGACRAAQAALSQDPANVLALRIKVRAHVALEEPEPLPALGDALLEAAPDRGWGSLAHGAHHVMRGEKALAARWLNKAETDRDTGTLLTVAAVWLAADRPAAAERVFKAVLDIDPVNVSALVGLALGAVARRDFMAAETALQRALKQDPGRPAIYLQLAQTYARTARKAEAARVAAIAVRLGAPPAMAAAARAGRLRG